MSDFKQVQAYNRVIITPASLESCGVEIRASAAAVPTNGTFTANAALFIPFVVYQPLLVTTMFVINGATVSGNVDVGIYDEVGNRLVSKGSTAQAGVSASQAFDIADTTLEPGCYYTAFVIDNNTGLVRRYTPGAIQPWVPSMGVLTQASAFPLPATAAFASTLGTNVPDVGVLARTVV